MDKDQTLIATADNTLFVNVPFRNDELDFRKQPNLYSYEKVTPVDAPSNLEEQEPSEMRMQAPQNQSNEPTYQLIESNIAKFIFPIADLQKIESCRVLRESDVLIENAIKNKDYRQVMQLLNEYPVDNPSDLKYWGN